MLWRLLGVGLAPALLFAGQARAQFTDVSAASGADVLAAKDGGATFGDLNGDGFLDLFVHANDESYLLISDGGSPPTFSDQTATLAPRLSTFGANRSALVADFDNDGYTDLFRDDNDSVEIYVSSGPLDYTFGDSDYFVDETIDLDINGEGAAAVDYDRDGWLDIFMENTGPQIFENPRDGTVNVTRLDPSTLGLPDGRAMMPQPNGEYVTAADIDGDGWVDLGYRDDTLPTIFVNQGDGTFMALSSPVISSDRKGGMIFCDFDSNGLFDFFYTGGSGGGRNRIHLQTAPLTFEEASTPTPAGSIRDAACGDVDNDGDIDLYLTAEGQNPLYLNRLTETGTMTFEEVDLGVGAGDNSESATFADYDNDGDLDLYVNQTGDVTQDTTVDPPRTIRDPARNALFRNDTDGSDYLMVEVLTAAAECPSPTLRSDIGATGSLSGPMMFESGVRQINGGQSHGSQGPPRMHFGLPLGADRDYQLTIRFGAEAYPEVTISVQPSSLGTYQLLTVDATDIDGDGILTVHEVADAGADPDPDGDGLPAWNDPDADGDGTPDADEAGDTDPCTPPVDADGSGVPDYLEGPVVPTDGGVDASGDTGVGADAVAPDGGDAGVGTVAAHGTGCVRCASGGDGGAGSTLAFFGLVTLSFLARRRSR